MKTLKIIIAVITLAVVVASLLTVSAYAYMGGRIGTPVAANSGAYAGSNGGYYEGMMGGRGMMAGYGNYNPSGTPSTSTSSTQYPIGGGGCGAMRSQLGYSGTYTTTELLNITTAVSIAENYIASSGNTNLAVSQVEEYTLNFYVLVKEKDTGIGAFELLVDKYTGAISPEMGPNMMWNTKYGMMSGGMMGWLTGSTTTPATVTVEQAKADAQQYLTAYYPGTTVGDAQAFYGYYHVEVLSVINVYGMLSVNSFTGQVWYHTWHGTFIQEVELS